MSEDVEAIGEKTQDLVGFFGHLYVTDPQAPAGRCIERQFEIIRKISGDRYAVQMFEWGMGEPSTIEVYSEEQLLGPDVKLYADDEVWRAKGDEQTELDRGRRGRERIPVFDGYTDAQKEDDISARQEIPGWVNIVPGVKATC